MARITVTVKHKNYKGLSTTVEAATAGDAIDLARVTFAAEYPELAHKNWTLKRMVPTGPDAFTATVSPAGFGSWDN